MALPQYYSSLRPFRETFRNGLAILTYHHVGPCRRGARLKGLYLSPKLFGRQMQELSAAGFTTPEYGQGLDRQQPGNPGQRVLLTFDDGFCDVLEHALPVLQRHQMRAMLFLVSGLLGKSNEWQQRAGDIREPIMDEAQVRDWLAAGQQIGAHTQSHPRLTQLSEAEAREEISASKKALQDRFGLPVEHFCYPYGDCNERVCDLVQAAGFKSACTTHSGLNRPQTPAFELRRITARYPSRSLKAIWRRLRGGG